MASFPNYHLTVFGQKKTLFLISVRTYLNFFMAIVYFCVNSPFGAIFQFFFKIAIKKLFTSVFFVLTFGCNSFKLLLKIVYKDVFLCKQPFYFRGPCNWNSEKENKKLPTYLPLWEGILFGNRFFLGGG